MSRKIYLLFIYTALSAMVSSCGFDSESNVDSGNREQILHFGNGDEPQELDPTVTTGIPEFQIQMALFEGLVSYHPKDLTIEPAAAETWDISNDLTIYTFHLRKNAKWSNGDPVTAHDFVYSWKRALTPAMGNLYAYMFYFIRNAEAYVKGDIKDFGQVGVTAIDDYTLRIELNAPTPFFLQILDHHSYYPVHKGTIEKFGSMAERGTRWTRPGNFVGNGPFTLKDWKLNRVLTVEKSPTYWDADRVRLNEIHFYPIQNDTTEERMFRVGQLHITEKIPIPKIAVYKSEDPSIVRITPWLGSYFYRLNITVKPLNDIRVRRALAMSIDREQLVRSVTKADEIPMYKFVPDNTNGYSSPPRIEYNIGKAKQLLAEAGYPDGKGFPELELIFNTDERHRQVAIAVQEMWKKALNINITLFNVDWKVYMDRETNMDYQITRAGWIGDYMDPNNFLDMWLSESGNNRTGFANAEYDQLIHQASLTADKDERFRILDRAEEILMRELPFLPLYTYTRRRLISPSVKGWYDNILDRHPYKYIYLEPEQ